ncbi:MAG: DNA helicase [Gemmatales bacterium]|nr:MAG: DNA helicase [Gemmatales bacterium]
MEVIMPFDHLADLTPAQREAVTHTEGPLLVLAGAGSGKTRVITRRIIHLLHEGIRPANILAITFTNKAAGEMRQRVEAMIPHSRVWISTFHAFGVRIMRRYAERFSLDRNFTIYDQDDRLRVVKAAIEAANFDRIRFSPDRVQAAISRAKNQLLTPHAYARKAGDFFEQVVAEIYPIYQKKLHDANAVDFDDLLLVPALALKHDAELRAELDAQFQYVLIDEYQDTNLAQYEIARGLSIDQPNLCVVGDPDQSIYKWRGSDLRNILDFERDFPNARIIALDRNYRSTQRILQAASYLIAHNRQRKRKQLTTDNDIGKPVQVTTYVTGLDEADAVARRIKEAVVSGRRHYRDFAVFMRINALSRAFETAFVKHRIPFQIVRGLAFFDRKENKDIMAYVRLLLNPRDDVSFLRIVNEPPRGIGKVSLAHLQSHAEARELSLLEAAAEADKISAIKGKAAAGLRDFAGMIRQLHQHVDDEPDALIRRVLDMSGYRAMLLASKDQQDAERLANIEELVTAARLFAAENDGATIADFVENITLAGDVDGWDDAQDNVAIMTLHASKGLEFPVVFIVAVEQGILPHERSLANDDDLEEERRLAFVGMTRAKEELYLSYSRMREFRGQTLYTRPSQFIEELPRDEIEHEDSSGGWPTVSPAIDEWRGGSHYANEGWQEAGIEPRRRRPKSPAAVAARDGDFSIGMIVRHDRYGQGTIVAVSGSGRQSSGARAIQVRR